jgi:hypothetical protein
VRSWITVVTGLPRSGTSLVMQMLGAGGLPLLCDESRRPDLDNPRGYFEYEPVMRIAEDSSWLDAAVGHGVKVLLGQLVHLPPGRAYRVILVERDLAEIMASQRTMLARQSARDGLPASGAGVDEAVDEAEEAALRGHLSAQLQAIAQGLAELPGVELHVAQHADLLAAARPAAEAMDAFLAGGLDVAAMAASVDPTLSRQSASGSRRRGSTL